MNDKKPNNLARNGAYINERHFNACNKKLVASFTRQGYGNISLFFAFIVNTEITS
jgi:hypothetical protein